MLHVYGLVDGDSIRGDVPPGHDGDPVAAFPGDGFTAIVSTASGARPVPNAANVWHHDKILHALMEEHAVVPLRFGTVCEPDALRALLDKRRQQTEHDLERVRGKVELALWLSRSSDAKGEAAPLRKAANDVPAGSGTAYLMARMTGRLRAANLGASELRQLCDRIDRLAAETVWNDEAWPVRGSCLIDRNEVPAFIDQAASLAGQFPDIGISCTGPWAPYSFVGVSAAQGGAA